MWYKLNSALRTLTPGIQKSLKQATHQWRTSQTPLFPIPSLVPGGLFWLHPSFLTHENYETLVQAQIKNHLKPGDVFIDVGANVGFHTLLGARLVGNKGRVLAFEPSKENVKLLAYHRRVNNLNQIAIYSDALGDEIKDSVDFVLVDGGRHSSNSLTFKHDVAYISEEQKQITQVSMTTIDYVCQHENVVPKLIKIDVEGAELFVLRGGKEVLTKHRPIIILGLHPFWMPVEHTPEKLNDFLCECGYGIKHVDGSKVEDLAFGDYIALPC
jgi:FkbM family methyltransferase